MAAKTTRNDVAKLAGVSPAVVSYVLNNSNYVSDAKRKAVLDAIKELNYSPNLFAKGLRTNRSSSIALVGDSLQGELFGPLSIRLLNNGFYSSLFYSQLNDSFIQRVIDGRFDAVFMTSNGFTSKQLNRIVENGTPMILYKSREYSGLSDAIVTMAPDFYDGVLQAMRYLIGKGHRRIAYVPPLRYRIGGLGGNGFRIRAYRCALEEAGISADERLVCTHTESVAEIWQDVQTMLALEQHPTAFVVGDDHLAAQLMQHLRAQGCSVPQQAAVVGWGNIPSATITTPQLTTVDGNVEEFAGEVAKALVDLANGTPVESRYSAVRLIERDSA